MRPEKLIRSANQIATFFRSYPEEEAVVGIRNHIEAFWTPRMRDDLAANVAAGGKGLDPLVTLAVQSLLGEGLTVEADKVSAQQPDGPST